MLWPRQISGALQRLKRDGIVMHLNEGERDRWMLVRADTEGGATDSVPYCRHCGSERLAYREQYANGREYQCRDCGEVLMW
jgi:hypothetical protein